MYTERPHLRYGGVYVSRNTYIRVGIINLDCRNPVHLVVYYRYFRFFEDGTVLTRTSPDPVSLVWKSLRTMPAVISKQDTRLPGRWRLKVRVHHCSCFCCPAVLLLVRIAVLSKAHYCPAAYAASIGAWLGRWLGSG